jgi:hypothetical protein
MSSIAHRYMELCERVANDSDVMNPYVEQRVERNAHSVFTSRVLCSSVGVFTNGLLCNNHEDEIKQSDKCNVNSLAFVTRTELVGRSTSNERSVEEHVSMSEIT